MQIPTDFSPSYASQLVEQIEALIARVLQIPQPWVIDELKFQSIQEWNSLTHVELMLALEKAYDIEIDADLIIKLNSVAAIRKFICQQERHKILKYLFSVEHGTEELTNQDQLNKVPIHRGLNGVFFDQTRITFIDGQAGKLLYRGYPIHELVEHSNFEETAYLLIYGELPTSPQLDAFDARLKNSRAIPASVVDLIRSIKHAHPMDVLRTAISALACFDPERDDDSYGAILRKGDRLIAQMPTVVATHQAFRSGRKPIAPSKTLSHAANFLYMLNGKEPSKQVVRLLDKDLILHADHSSNASAFTARVVVSTHADLHSALTAAIAAFSGQLHAGAAEEVMKMIQKIGEPEQVPNYIAKLRAESKPVMGFGHRVYRTHDPRAYHLREVARLLSAELGETKWYEIIEALVKEMQPYIRHGIGANVDLYTGVIYYLLGISQDLCTPIFTLSRIPGWIAQVIEQHENNILIRPLLQYTGELERPYTMITQR